MLTAILSALVVILLSAAVIDVILRRRDEKVRNDPDTHPNLLRVLTAAGHLSLAPTTHTGEASFPQQFLHPLRVEQA